MFFSLGWIPSKVEGDISTSKEVHDYQIAFQKNCASLWNHQQFTCLLLCLLHWLFLKKTKRLLLRLNKFSVWQPLKDLCLLTTMSVGMCNRNFLYQQKKVIQFTKRGEKVIWKYKSIVNYQHLWQLLAIYCSLVMCTTTVSN